MKMLKVLTLGMLLSAWAGFNAGLSYAEPYTQEESLTLAECAAALRGTNPDLANQLTTFAEKASGRVISMGMKSEGETQGNVKLLRDSATELEQTYPKLAAFLRACEYKESRSDKA